VLESVPGRDRLTDKRTDGQTELRYLLSRVKKLPPTATTTDDSWQPVMSRLPFPGSCILDDHLARNTSIELVDDDDPEFADKFLMMFSHSIRLEIYA